MTTQAVGDRRLLRLADILDVADAKHRAAGDPTYCQHRSNNECGTPSCALGHWAAATPRRWTWEERIFPILRPNSGFGSSLADAMDDFALEAVESVEIFGRLGCNHARTAKQAAKFIRKFVKARAPK